MKKFIARTGIILVLYTAVSGAAAKAQEIPKKDFVYDSRGKRDPLWPLVSSTGNIINYETEFQVSDLKLEGIILGAGGDNLAIINGQIVKRQDRLGPFLIVDVGADTVVLSRDQETFELKLKKEE